MYVWSDYTISHPLPSFTPTFALKLALALQLRNCCHLNRLVIYEYLLAIGWGKEPIRS
jgi:hypothetical protein